MTEAHVPFHDKTLEFARAWRTERARNLPHDFLLHNKYGRPFTKASLHKHLARILCKTLGGKVVNNDGLDRWSTHRLRHTMASRLASGGANVAAVMAVGRWASFSNMTGYTRVDEDRKLTSYHEATERAKNTTQAPQRVMTQFKKGIAGLV